MAFGGVRSGSEADGFRVVACFVEDPVARAWKFSASGLQRESVAQIESGANQVKLGAFRAIWGRAVQCVQSTAVRWSNQRLRHNAVDGRRTARSFCACLRVVRELAFFLSVFLRFWP